MKIIKNFIRLLLLLLVIFIAVVVSQGYQLFREALSETSLEDKVTEIKSISNYTTLEEMPEMYKKAVVGAEDSRFYMHNGVDIISTGRAIWNDITSFSFAEGGSTITQQLAKNSYFTQEKRLTRKIAEIFMAWEYEENYSKDEILELYLNTCYFGEGCYTVKEAAKVYFDKLPIEMTDYESIMLSGIPNAPSVYAPTVNPELAEKRLEQVLQKLIYVKVMTEEEADRILKEVDR